MDERTVNGADVIVVGGGPAGLTAALYLARFRRKVLVVDSGSSRVASIPTSHNYPGFVDGVHGKTLLANLEAQLRHYPVQRLQSTVHRIAKESRSDDTAAGFRVEWMGGSAQAPFVLLATGVADVPPDMPHAREALDKGLLRYCPVCDAYEASGKQVGVYARDEGGVGEALYLRHFSPHVTLFLQEGEPGLGAAARERLRAGGVGWEPEPVCAIRAAGLQVALRHGDRETLCDTLYCALGVRVHSSLAQQLGARADAQGYLEVDRHHQTTVAGLYAIGDVSQGLNQIAVAAGAAAIASAAVHNALHGRTTQRDTA